ncbi:hypothetical protein Syun_022799 [Stephania yunnanensis]|uniref:Uncharacterized protein n=1 Tax=Stephania yunnanensis TaxID=152371 RepID=A0AAP0FEB1_9MAGN
MSFTIYEAWYRKTVIRYTSNIYLIAKKRITPIYLTYEVFEHYKRTRAIDEAFKKKFEQMSANRKSEVGGPGTGISLHSTATISARQHGDISEKIDAELIRVLEEMSTQFPDTSIDEDAVYLEVYAVMAFGIGVAYKEGVDKVSLFLLGHGSVGGVRRVFKEGRGRGRVEPEKGEDGGRGSWPERGGDGLKEKERSLTTSDGRGSGGKQQSNGSEEQ